MALYYFFSVKYKVKDIFIDRHRRKKQLWDKEQYLFMSGILITFLHLEQRWIRLNFHWALRPHSGYNHLPFDTALDTDASN